jgi:hypothetical protein
MNAFIFILVAEKVVVTIVGERSRNQSLIDYTGYYLNTENFSDEINFPINELSILLNVLSQSRIKLKFLRQKLYELLLREHYTLKSFIN